MKIKTSYLRKLIKEQLLNEDYGDSSFIFKMNAFAHPKSFNKMKLIGKANKGYDSDYLINSHSNYVTTIWIDGIDRNDAFNKIELLKAYDGLNNVYYYGDLSKAYIDKAVKFIKQHNMLKEYTIKKKVNEVIDENDYAELRDIIRAEIASVFFDLFRRRAIWI